MPNKRFLQVMLFFRKVSRLLETIFFILKKILSERHFIYLGCVLISVTTALAVILLKNFAHNVYLLATYINGYAKLPYINSILPVIGILLTVFVVRNFLGGKIEKGSSQILHSVAKKGGIMPKRQMYTQIITSSLTVGLGGSAGLESPINVTGAAIGSNFAQKYKLSKRDRILLLACGVAAGIGAAFNAPIAGVLFAIEVVLTDVTITAFVPIIISAATGSVVSTVLLNDDVLLSYKQQEMFDYHNIPFYILLGVCAGFISFLHAKNFQRVEGYFKRSKKGDYQRAIFGASILALMIFFMPTLFGEGYEGIKSLVNNNPQALLDNTLLESFKNSEWVILLFIGFTMFAKSIATGLTIGSGGNGGNFAPSLFVGSYLGFIIARLVNMTGIEHQLPVGNFTVVGMAGILSGIFHAPLTAIFLIGEITGGYDLMIPLMIVSSISFAVSKRFETHSIDVKLLARSGKVFTSNRDQNILLNIDLMKLVDTSTRTINIKDSVDDVIRLFSSTKQHNFAVVNPDGHFIGMITLDEIRPIIFDKFKLKFSKLEQLISQPKAVINFDENLESIMLKFDANDDEMLPVVSDLKFYGFIAKLDILEEYRKSLKDMVIE